MRTKRGFDTTGLTKLERFRRYYAGHPDQFIEKYCKIRTKVPGAPIQPLVMKPGQKQVMDAIREQKEADRPIRLVILKSRQVGISTLVAAHVFGQCYNQDNMEAMVMAHRADVTTNMFRTYRRYLEYLPSELQIPLERSNKEELIWKPTNTVIKVATAGTADSTRSRTINWFHGSEAAFYKDLPAVRQAMEGSVPDLPGCGIIWETTAFGTGTPFHNIWQEAGDPDSLYNQVFLKWFLDSDCEKRMWTNERGMDEYLEKIFSKKPSLVERMKHYNLTPEQICFYYETCKDKYSGDDIKMATEFPCDPDEAFVATGSPVFPTHLTLEYRKNAKPGKMYDPTEPMKSVDTMREGEYLHRNKDTYLEMWVPPQQNRHYVIAVDPAAGLINSDFTSMMVFDILTQNIVAELHGRMEIKKAADMLIELAMLYKGAAGTGALIVPENDGLGHSLLSHIKDRYFRIYQWRKADSFGWKTTNILGWETTEQSRLEMITTARRLYAERVKDGAEFIPSKMLIEELGTFVHSAMLNSKAVADRNCYDDRVMAWAIGVTVCLQELQCNPDLAALVDAVKQAVDETKTDKVDVSELIRMVKDPRWVGKPLTAEQLDGPFFQEDYDDGEESI